MQNLLLPTDPCRPAHYFSKIAESLLFLFIIHYIYDDIQDHFNVRCPGQWKSFTSFGVVGVGI